MLYAVLVACLVLLVWPRMRPVAVGAIAFACCLALEAFQLTGIPARAPRFVQLALGTTFAWHDVACYLVGAVTVVVVLSRRRRVA